ncbi:MAG: hypothetical protein JWN30_1894 [Bacilli bacterium]|nr:hypothetical protein [Bacilli bacterium]
MWNRMDGVMDVFPGRRRNNGGGMNTFTAIVVGAGIGIATWEVMKRRGGINQVMNRATNSNQD